MEPRWLDKREAAAWRSLLVVSTRLFEKLDHELRDAHGLRLDEYEVLVHLSEAPDDQLRMSELADRVLVSRSRLTHLVDRMDSAGLVARRRCTEDGRGTWAVLTPDGRARIEAAAPSHVERVRCHFFNHLGGNGSELARLLEPVADHLAVGPSRAG